MSFNKLMLTTDGKTLFAKAQQGKTLQFTRVAIGDGLIGSGSLVNRSALISEKKSMLIDSILVVNLTELAVVVSLSNTDIAESFYFNEIGLFAKDPDTLQEKLYLYDNTIENGEPLPTAASGTIVNERLKLLIAVDNVASVTFNASGNPLYLAIEDISDGSLGSNVLWSATYIDQRLTEIQSTAADDATSKANAAISTAADDATSKANAAQAGAISTAADDATSKANAARDAAKAASIPLTQKGSVSGVAELDSSGKVPSAQLPSFVDDVLEYANLASFPASGESGKIYVALDTNLTYRWSGSAYVEISQSLALGETPATAYRGDRGKTAYEHSQATGNPHSLTIAMLGGGNATCATAAATAAKVATLSGYILTVGTPLIVEFTNANTATNVTVNCNSQGAKSVMVNGSAAAWWQIPQKAVLSYNGTNYNLLNPIMSLKKTATLAVASWAGSSAPYTYTLSDSDIIATDTPDINRVTGTDAAAAALINTAWSLITGYAVNIQISAGTITFYATAKPSVAIPIMYKVVRS